MSNTTAPGNAPLGIEADLLKTADKLRGSLESSESKHVLRREQVRARLRVLVKDILEDHGYPPDLSKEAVRTVLAQAEVLSARWASA